MSSSPSAIHSHQQPSSPPHALHVDEFLKSLGTDPEHGLHHRQVEELRSRYGPNELAAAPRPPWWKRFAGQFAQLVIWILIAAAIISGVLGEWLDTVVILTIVVLNGTIGFIQEERAEQALAALQKLSAPQAKTIRDGQLQILAASELVPGDRIELKAGDRMPADVRLIGTAGFRAQEAALTGESVPVDKDHRQVLDEDTPMADRVNMAYMGTTVAAGSAIADAVGDFIGPAGGTDPGSLGPGIPRPTHPDFPDVGPESIPINPDTVENPDADRPFFPLMNLKLKQRLSQRSLK